MRTERLAHALGRKGWTQRDLARALGVREATVSGWAHGKPAGRDSITSAASVLDVSIDWLLGASDAGGPSPLNAAAPSPDTRSGGVRVNGAKDGRTERDRLLDMLQQALTIADEQAKANHAQATANERTAAAAERAAAAAERLAAQLSPLRNVPAPEQSQPQQGSSPG
jgi:transcriptional regulator with XRE-family HTH domain